MKITVIQLLVFFLLPLSRLCSGVDADIAKWNGVYLMCEDVAGYSGEVVVLKDGKFSYWFYSDVVGGLKEIRYPLKGSYTIKDKSLTLDHEDINSKVRTLDEVNGHKVLWRDDGLKYWNEEKGVHPYAVLIRTANDLKEEKDLETLKRPALNLIKSAEILALEEKRYKERYNDIPEPARGLYRAQTAEDPAERAQLDSLFSHFRKNPSAELFKQLVILGASGKDVYYEFFLGPLIDPGENKEETLRLLVESMSFTNADCLGKLMTCFLKESGIYSFDMKFPESGVHLAWKVNGNNLQSTENWAHGAPEGFDWRKEPKQVITTCQKWCREQLDKRKNANLKK